MSENVNHELSSFLTQLGKEDSLRIEERLGSGFVKLRVSEAERRQAAHDIRCSEDIVIELLRNSRDAGAHLIFVATTKDGANRTITVLDDGSGIPRDLWPRVFDARVTSKLESAHVDRWGVHGRGMALYSIRQNALEARVCDSIVGGGTSIHVTSDLAALPERSDQSTWPTLSQDASGAASIAKGPHNIIRTCCEFALEEKERCEVYLGSPAEMIATIRHKVHGRNLVYAASAEDLTQLPVLERLRVAADARELREVAAQLGFDISERTAHRILAGEIASQSSAVAHLMPSHRHRNRKVDLLADRRGLRLSDDDRATFTALMEEAFAQVADRYYLTLSEPPRLRVSGSRMTVTFTYQEED